jgi:hypothetical protein
MIDNPAGMSRSVESTAVTNRLKSGQVADSDSSRSRRWCVQMNHIEDNLLSKLAAGSMGGLKRERNGNGNDELSLQNAVVLVVYEFPES